MNEGQIALIVSILSAIFTGWTLIHTRRLSINDSRRMRRKNVIMELNSDPQHNHQGWDYHVLTIRNLEPIAARIEQLKSKPPSSLILLEDDALDQATPYGGRTGFNTTMAGNPVSVKRDLPPVPLGPAGRSPVLTLVIYTQGVASVHDIVLRWEWADGRPP